MFHCGHPSTLSEYTHTHTQPRVESVTAVCMCVILTALSCKMLTEGSAALCPCILLLHEASSQPLTFLFTALYIVKIMYEVSKPQPLHGVCMCVCVSVCVCAQLKPILGGKKTS